MGCFKQVPVSRIAALTQSLKRRSQGSTGRRRAACHLQGNSPDRLALFIEQGQDPLLLWRQGLQGTIDKLNICVRRDGRIRRLENIVE